MSNIGSKIYSTELFWELRMLPQLLPPNCGALRSVSRSLQGLYFWRNTKTVSQMNETVHLQDFPWWVRGLPLLCSRLRMVLLYLDPQNNCASGSFFFKMLLPPLAETLLLEENHRCGGRHKLYWQPPWGMQDAEGWFRDTPHLSSFPFLSPCLSLPPPASSWAYTNINHLILQGQAGGKQSGRRDAWGSETSTVAQGDTWPAQFQELEDEHVNKTDVHCQSWILAIIWTYSCKHS